MASSPTQNFIINALVLNQLLLDIRKEFRIKYLSFLLVTPANALLYLYSRIKSVLEYCFKYSVHNGSI